MSKLNSTKEIICKIIAVITFLPMGIAAGLTMMAGIGVILLVVDVFFYIAWAFTGHSPFEMGGMDGYWVIIYACLVIHIAACQVGDFEFGYPLE